MNLLSSWRAALRIARREALHSKGRSALVVAMICVPVLFLSAFAVTDAMFTLTGQEQANQLMGTADARVTWDYRVPVTQTSDGQSTGVTKTPDGDAVRQSPVTEAELVAGFPAGTNAIPLRTGSVSLRTVAGSGDMRAVSLDADSPLTHGLVSVIRGRAPRTTTEAALTSDAVKRVGGGVGSTVTSPDGTRTYTVVGLVEFPQRLEETVLFAPISEPAPAGMALDQAWLVDTDSPVSWQQIVELNKLGMVIVSRDTLINPPPETAELADPVSSDTLAAGVLIGGMALLEVVLLAGPAFAVSARRRQRQLALVAANGGTAAHVRRIVLADGVVLGAVGAVVGVVLGIGTAFAARPYVEELLVHQRAGGYRVFPTALAAIAGLAVVVGVLAALFPAFIVARQNLVVSLAGRRGATRSKKRWLVFGLAMIAAGLVVTWWGAQQVSANIMLTGMVVGELGMVACTPALIGLVARLGRSLPLAPRIALRDAARNRAAAAPAIAAVMAAVAGSVAVGLYLGSAHAQNEAESRPMAPIGNMMIYAGLSGAPGARESDAPAIFSAIREVLPDSHAFQMSRVGCPTSASPSSTCDLELLEVPERQCPYEAITMTRSLTADEAHAARRDSRCAPDRVHGSGLRPVVVDDAATLAALTGAGGDDLASAVAVLRAGGVVVPTDYIIDGRATFSIITYDEKQVTDPRQNAPRISMPASALATGIHAPRAFVSTRALATTALRSVPDQTFVVATTRIPTQAEQDALNSKLSNLQASAEVQRGPLDDADPMLWILAAVSAAIALGATAVATGLAAADGRSDLSTLAAVGASPRLRRGLSLSQAGVIAGLGSLLGAVAGTGVAAAVLTALNQSYADVWPSPSPYPIVVPWLSLAIALGVVPLIAMAGAGTLTRSRLPIERRL